MIVRWGLDQVEPLLAELGIERPFLIASERWSKLDLPSAGRWDEVPSDGSPEVAAAAAGSDGVLAVGGGSAIDLAKAVSAATGLPVVSVPTTYSGAEWTTFFGVRDPDRRMKGGGAGARLGGIVYEPELTLDLSREQSGGTALNALAHSAEALYVADSNPEATGTPWKAPGSSARRCHRCWRTATTSRLGRHCSRAQWSRALPSGPPGSVSATRWRRRWAAATASRTARRTR